MKIAIPVNDKSMDSGVCTSFGRTPYFLFYDVKSKESIFLENSAAKSQGGAGIKAAQIVADNKANIMLTPRCGQNAADVLNAADIKIYKTTNDSIEDNISAFTNGRLSVLEEIHEGFHGHVEK